MGSSTAIGIGVELIATKSIHGDQIKWANENHYAVVTVRDHESCYQDTKKYNYYQPPDTGLEKNVT